MQNDPNWVVVRPSDFHTRRDSLADLIRWAEDEELTWPPPLAGFILATLLSVPLWVLILWVAWYLW